MIKGKKSKTCKGSPSQLCYDGRSFVEQTSIQIREKVMPYNYEALFRVTKRRPLVG